MMYWVLNDDQLPVIGDVGLEHGTGLARRVIVTHGPHVEVVFLDDLPAEVMGAQFVLSHVNRSGCFWDNN